MALSMSHQAATTCGGAALSSWRRKTSAALTPTRTARAARSSRGSMVVVAGKRGAWAKEFAPKEETAEEEAEEDEYPGLAKDTDAASFNILVKKTGPLSLTWNGVGVLQIPKGSDDKESSNLAKVVLLQRKDQVMREVDRLYPKLKAKPKDFVIQPFEDPYADPVDMTQVPPETLEIVPAEVKYLKKGKRFGA